MPTPAATLVNPTTPGIKCGGGATQNAIGSLVVMQLPPFCQVQRSTTHSGDSESTLVDLRLESSLLTAAFHSIPSPAHVSATLPNPSASGVQV